MLIWILVLGCACPVYAQTTDMTAPWKGKIGEFKLTDYIAARLIEKISRKTDLQVRCIALAEPNTIQLTLVDGDQDGTMIMRIKGLSLQSSDFLSGPLDTVLTLELILTDGQKNITYSRMVRGKHQMLLGELQKENGLMSLIEVATENALSQYAEDPELKKMIAKLKYGVMGNLARFV